MVKFYLCLASILSWLCILPYNSQAQNKLSVTKPVHLIFDVYNKNLHVVVIKASYMLTDNDYTVQASFRFAGLVSLFANLDMTSSIQGHIQNNKVLPMQFKSFGKSKGQKFTTLINFNNPQHVEIKILIPQRESNRDALSQDQMNNSLDMLSAMIELIYRVRANNQCDDQFKILDGSRLFTFKSQSAGRSIIPSTWASPYRGEALFCKAVTQQIGGLKHSRHRALMSRPQPSYIWFKNVDKVGILPIRFDFDHPKMGNISIILRKVSFSSK